MRPRRVVVALHIDTNLPLERLRNAHAYAPLRIHDPDAMDCHRTVPVLHANANVMRRGKR